MADSRIWGSGEAKPIHISDDGLIRPCEDPGHCRFKERNLQVAVRADADHESMVLALAARLFHENLLKLPAGHIAVRDMDERGIPITDEHLGWMPSRQAALRQLRASGLTDLDLLESGLADLAAGSTDLQIFAHDRLTISVHDAGRVAAFYARSYADKTCGPRTAKIGDATATMTSGLKYVRSRPASYMVPPRDPKSQRFTKPYEDPMFLLDENQGEIRKRDAIIIVEGQLDALACTAAGIKNVVAIAGMTNFYQHQLDECKCLLTSAGKIILCLDADDAGIRGLSSVIRRFPDEDIRACSLPDGKDPCEYRAEHGDDALRRALDDHEDGKRFMVRRTPYGEIPRLIAAVNDAGKRDDLIRFAAGLDANTWTVDGLADHVRKLYPVESHHAHQRPYRERRRWVRALGVYPGSLTPSKSFEDRLRSNDRLRLIASVALLARRDGVTLDSTVRSMVPKKLRSADDADPIWKIVEDVMDEGSLQDLLDKIRSATLRHV
jgi:hypothetical protein